MVENSAVLHNSLLLTHLANFLQSQYVRNWKNYIESLVKRGEILLDFDVIDNWNTELSEMNKDKEGRKFVYPDSFIKLLGYLRAYFHLPYRQTEGVVREHASNSLPSIPHYSNISRRINRLDIEVSDDVTKSSLHDDYFVIAIDSTGIKVTNREANGLGTSGISREVI